MEPLMPRGLTLGQKHRLCPIRASLEPCGLSEDRQDGREAGGSGNRGRIPLFYSQQPLGPPVLIVLRNLIDLR